MLLDKRTDWLEMGRLLYLVDKEKRYEGRGHNSFDQWAKSGTLNDKLSKRDCRRFKDAYRRLCVDYQVDPSGVKGVRYSKIDVVLTLIDGVDPLERSHLFSILRRRTAKGADQLTFQQLTQWKNAQNGSGYVNVRDLEKYVQLGEPEISKLILDDHKDLLGQDGIKLFNGGWGIIEEPAMTGKIQKLDLVGKDKENMFVAIELKREPVDSRAVGQALAYTNQLREIHHEQRELKYRRGQASREEPQPYPLKKHKGVRGGIIGHDFSPSSYYAGKQTDLTFYRTDWEFKRVLSFISMRSVTKEDWEKFAKD